tara:strand:+ start:299 stop:613 length:315 start_codon:yes stop_codon:yes gene_type:complete
MAKELNEDTGFNVSIKTLAGIGMAIATVVGMWFALQADIQEAKDLPLNEWNPEWLEKLPPPSITRMEFDMKDQLVRQTIMTTQEDVKEIKEQLKNLNDKIDALR